MSAEPDDLTPALIPACQEFWRIYYAAIMRLHTRSGRTLRDAIQDRNLATTDSKHIAVFERFWRRQLASGLGVPESEVGPRRIKFRPHRGKNFDVCWPLKGDPLPIVRGSVQTANGQSRGFSCWEDGDVARVGMHRPRSVGRYNLPAGRGCRPPRASWHGRSSRQLAPAIEENQSAGHMGDRRASRPLGGGQMWSARRSRVRRALVHEYAAAPQGE
jgi:hypothetical protein